MVANVLTLNCIVPHTVGGLVPPELKRKVNGFPSFKNYPVSPNALIKTNPLID